MSAHPATQPIAVVAAPPPLPLPIQPPPAIPLDEADKPKGFWGSLFKRKK
jgi:hypothetical protein